MATTKPLQTALEPQKVTYISPIPIHKKAKVKENLMINIALSLLTDKEKMYIEFLYLSEAKKLWGLCLRMLGDRELAQDALQSTFEKLIAKLPLLERLESWDKIRGYAYVVARNTALHIVRKQKYRNHANIDDLEQRIFDSEFDTEEAAIAHVEHTQLSEYIASLKPEYKEAIYLRYHLGLKYREIAEATHTTSANARYRVKSGIAAVQRKVKGQGVTDDDK